MPLKPYEEFADPLAFPIGGRVYTVPPLPYRAGLRLQRILAGEDTAEDLPAEDLWRMVMGDAWDQMVADDVPLEAMSRAGIAAVADFRWGRATAENVWESGVDPEALAAALTAANPSSKDFPDSTSTAKGSETPSRGSSSATTSPPGTPRPKRKGRSSPS